MLNKEYENAISLLSDLNKKCPNDMDIQYNLLDALFAVGKDETAVDWIIKPKIMRLDRNALDYLYNFMKRKRKPRTIHELYLELYNEGYPAFNKDQLMVFLHSDNRFEFTGSEDESHNCLVKVARK